MMGSPLFHNVSIVLKHALDQWLPGQKYATSQRQAWKSRSAGGGGGGGGLRHIFYSWKRKDLRHLHYGVYRFPPARPTYGVKSIKKKKQKIVFWKKWKKFDLVRKKKKIVPILAPRIHWFTNFVQSARAIYDGYSSPLCP